MKSKRIISIVVIALLAAADLICFAFYAGQMEIRSIWQIVGALAFHAGGLYAIWSMIDGLITWREQK